MVPEIKDSEPFGDNNTTGSGRGWITPVRFVSVFVVSSISVIRYCKLLVKTSGTFQDFELLPVALPECSLAIGTQVEPSSVYSTLKVPEVAPAVQ